MTPSVEDQKLFPLSLNQMNIWALECSVPDTSINNISATILIQGRVDYVLLQEAVRLVLKLDASLRTRITLRDGVPMQYHAAYEDITLPLLDFSAADEDSFSHWVERCAQTPLFAEDSPLYHFAMCRTGNSGAALFVQTHHIISDGWTQITLCNRIGEAYLALLEGRAPEWEEFPDYADFTADEQRYLTSSSYERDRAFWETTLQDAGEAASLRGIRSSTVSHVGRRKRFRLSQQMNHAIYSYCCEHRVAPFAVFYMALATYLKRIGTGDRFTIGVPVFNRSSYQYRQTSGMFVSTLPFVGEVNDEWSFNTFLDHFSMQWMDILRHQRFPFARMEEMHGDNGPLFHIMLSFQDNQMLESPDASVRISGAWHYSGCQTEQLCINLTNLEGNRIYAVDYDYLAQVFSQKNIEELHQYLCHILNAGLQNPDTPIRDLVILDPEERERVIYGNNQTYAPRFDRTPYEVLQLAVKRRPKQVAVIHNGVRTTYQSLLQQGNCVAAALKQPQKLAAVLLPRDVRLFAAMVGIMQANCAWLFLTPDQPALRIAEILRQSGADYLISTPELSEPFTESGVTILNIDSLQDACCDIARGNPEDLAYVVYTSGSTGTPKGVEISQKSLVNLAMDMAPIYQSGAVLSLCSVGFDAFILESAAALLCGCMVLLANDQQKESPDALADLIADYGLDFLATTPSRLSALMDSPRFSAAVYRLKTIVCGGEMFPGELLQRLIANTNARIYNQYGPSEATVAVSMARLDTAEQITVGRPMDNCHLYILDESMQPLPVNVCGELYIGGVCVGLGYRNAPELTAGSFLPSPFIHGETLYKTGDIACWNEAGELSLSGRRDDQVKIRGLRIELQEITRCFCSHPEILTAAVRILDHCGQQILVAYYVADRDIPELELLGFVAAYLPGYMVPSRALRVDAIPLTRNGKADLSGLPVPTDDVVSLPPAGEAENEILQIFREVLHNPTLGADSNYFLSGGNSLNAMETISRLEERFGVHPMISDLYVCRSARNLASFLSLGSGQKIQDTVSPAPAREFYPLSDTQKSLYLQSCLDETGLAYHMPCAFRFSEAPDIPRLEEAFCRLLEDDALYRTRFVLRGGDIAAIPADHCRFSLPILNEPTREKAFRSFLRPFDLSEAPLLRAALWQDEDGQWLLLVDMHHIIGDGQSTPMMLQRLDAFYRGSSTDAHLTYHDYSVYRADRPSGDDTSLEYWKDALAGCPAVLDLPPDRVRPQNFSFRGGMQTVSLSAEANDAVERFCAENELTPYMFFAGVLGILLSRISGENDIVIGSPVSGRTRPELQNVCGPLMDTMPLRLRPEGDTARYFAAVKQSVLAMLDHAGTTLDDILTALDIPRSQDRNPLYQVLFQVRPLDVDSFRIGGISLEYIPIPTDTAKLDLYIEAGRVGTQWKLFIEYASDVFEAETAAFYGRCMDALICSLSAAGPDTDVSALGALTAGDRLRCIDRPLRKSSFFPDMTVTEVIAEETLLHPDSTAVIWHDQKISFAELERRACQIAGILRSSGARPGDRIGLVCRRTPDLLASLLAILRCGCAYVPFLYSFPAARVSYMMETADVRLILCDENGREELPEEARVRPVVYTDSQAEPETELCPRQGSDPMYILFTSGSTGKPKGVQLPHRALSNLLESMRTWMRGETGPFLCSTNATFDIFITETLLALAQGFSVLLADEEEMLLPWKLAELIRTHRPTLSQFTPSRLQVCLHNTAFAESLDSLRFTIVAGEAMPASLVSRFCTCCPGRLINMYGPTEAAVYVSAGELRPDETVTIGAPLQNCRIYVLDPQLRPVLPTARGELYLAGPCLSDGYISRPDLTAERFLDDPFVPGEKMYRSGDLGRLRMDGTLDCLGRTDSQVKINGNRVELGEITEVLLSAGARQAAVFARKNPDGTDALIAAASPETLSVSALREKLASALPGYMIPTSFFLLPELPQNASGKIDLPAVKRIAELEKPSAEDSPSRPTLSGQAVPPVPPKTPEPTPPAAAEAPAIPEPPDPKPAQAPQDSQAPAVCPDSDSLLDIWKSVLLRDDLRPDISFFEQGGTSLSALHILGEYYNRRIQMTLSDFYHAPTVLAQSELLRERYGTEHSEPAAYTASRTGGDSIPAEKTYTSPDPAYPKPSVLSGSEVMSAGSDPLPDRPGRNGELLLTGATGFLGAHLLRSFLVRGETNILCLLRDGDAHRLRSTLAWYFGEGWADAHFGMLETVKGDINQTHLGLPEDEYRRLCSRVSVICHTAADVRHYAADSKLTQTNLSGTENVLQFASDAHAELMHISTASVSGDYVAARPEDLHIFREDDCDIGQNWQDNLYIRSKFLAEQAVLRAAENGLTARIFRIGRLVGRYSDGVFQRNAASNAFFRVVSGIGYLHALPASLAAAPLELSPVDICAEAIASLRHARPGVYHVIQPRPLPLKKALLPVISDLEILDDETFSARLSRAAGQDPSAVASLIDIWNSRKSGNGNVMVSSEKTHYILQSAGFVWPEDLLHALDAF